MKTTKELLEEMEQAHQAKVAAQTAMELSLCDKISGYGHVSAHAARAMATLETIQDRTALDWATHNYLVATRVYSEAVMVERHHKLTAECTYVIKNGALTVKDGDDA